MIKIAPSILTANLCKIDSVIRMLDTAGADMIHLDVMDGEFVPNITFGHKTVADMRALTALPLDVHLMVSSPDKHIENFAAAGADIISVHLESKGAVHLHRTLTAIRKLGKRAGICINPATSHTALEYLYEDIDVITVMSVNPGYGGQAFIPQSIRKIECIAKRIHELNVDVAIEVDGGINEKTAKLVVNAGATILVAGQAVIGAADAKSAIAALRG